TLETRNGPHPEHMVSSLENGLYAAGTWKTLERVFPAHLSVDYHQFRSTDPQAASIVFAYRVDGKRRHTVLPIHTKKAIHGILEEPIIGAHPQDTLMVFIDNTHEIIAQPIRHGIMTEDTHVITHQPSAIRTGP